MSSIDGASVVSEGPTTQKYRFKTSYVLLGASYVGVAGLILVVVAFSSPYWLSSHKYTYSQFVRLGLWNFCFDHYKHPQYQYDETFTGCRWIYHPKYHNIRDWLQPGWFIFVQAMMTLSLIFSVFALLSISIPIMHFVLRYNVILIGLGFILESLSAITCFLGWLVFAIKHDSRAWLMNPRFNHLDWAFYLAVLASLINLAAAVMLAMEAKAAQAKRQRFTNLVYNMQNPRSAPNGFEMMPLKSPGEREEHSLVGVRQSGMPRFGEDTSLHSSPYASLSRYQAASPAKSSPRHFTAV